MLFPLYLCIYERNNNIIFTKSYHVLYGNIFDNSATVYSLGAHLYRCTCWRHRPWYLWYGGRVYLGFHLRTEAREPAYRRDVNYRLGHHCGSFPASGRRIRLSCRACASIPNTLLIMAHLLRGFSASLLVRPTHRIHCFRLSQR